MGQKKKKGGAISRPRPLLVNYRFDIIFKEQVYFLIIRPSVIIVVTCYTVSRCLAYEFHITCDICIRCAFVDIADKIVLI